MLEFLESYHGAFVALHVLFMAIGLGAATISDILFFKFLKDFRLSRREVDVLKTLSSLIWTVLPLVVLTGIALYLPEAERLNQSPKFLAKMIVVVIIIVNGIGLNLIITPRLEEIFGSNKHRKQIKYMRKLAFGFGAISITSWYSAFILASYRGSLGFESLLLIYLALLASAVLVSQFLEHRYAQRSS